MNQTSTIMPAMNALGPSDFVAEFAEITGLRPAFDEEYLRELERLPDFRSSQGLRPLAERHWRLSQACKHATGLTEGLDFTPAYPGASSHDQSDASRV